MQALWLGILVGVVAMTAAAVPTTVERVEGTLHLQAAVPSRSFAAGAPIVVSLSARNTGSAALTVSFASGQRYDVVVRRPRGDEVWRWSHDKAFIQMVQTVTLNPGEVLTFRVPWDQQDLQGRRIDPGTYEIVAIFMGQVGGAAQGPLSLPPLTITINP